MERRHARFGSSNAHRWLACPASVKDDAPPEIPNKERADGEHAHAILASCLTNSGAPLREVVGDEITDAVNFALDHISSLEVDDMIIEKWRPFPQHIVPQADCGGTGDVIAWPFNVKVIYNIDFKYGAGVFVEAEENEQLLFNAAAGCWNAHQPERIVNTIIQPRHWGGVSVRTWECGVAELVEFKFRVEDALRLAVEQPDLEVPGTHCQFCPRAVICKARESAGLAVVGLTDVREAPVLPAPEDLPLDKLSHILENGAILSDWLKDVRKYAFDLVVRRKVAIPGFKIVEAKPQRRFDGDVVGISNKLSALSHFEYFPADFAPPTLVGVGEAEKMLKRAAKENTHHYEGDAKLAVESVMRGFAFLTTKASSGSITLVPLSDPRPPINPALAFQGVVLPPEEE